MVFDRSMFQRFLTLTADRPDAAALVDGESGVATTRAELLARAEEIASRSSLREGEVLAVQLPNGVDFVAAFLAALKLKLVFAPIDRDAARSEVAGIGEDFGILAPRNA